MTYRYVVMAGLLLLLASCAKGNSTREMQVPVLDAQNSSKFGSGESETSSLGHASFRLHRIVAAIKRGEVIAHFPHRYWKKWRRNDLCNISYGRNATLEWGSGPREFGNWKTEFGKVFYDAMKSRGASVVGDPTKIFGVTDSADAAEFLVGARIVEIKGNLCQKHDYWNARPLPEFLGEFYLKIEWEVFSSLSRQVVYSFATEGYARSKRGRRQGYKIIFANAFADAVERAAENEGFKKILGHKPGAPVVADSRFETLELAGPRLYRTSIKRHLRNVRAAVVTIELVTLPPFCPRL